MGHSVLQTSEAAALPIASFKDEAAVDDVDDEADQVSIRDGLEQCRGKAAPYPPVGGGRPFVGAPQYILY